MADRWRPDEAHVAQTGAMPRISRTFDQAETCWARERSGWNWKEDAPDIDTLLSRSARRTDRRHRPPGMPAASKIVAVEPEQAPTLHTRPSAAACTVDAPAGGIAADSLARRRVGELMFSIAHNPCRGSRAGQRRRHPRGANQPLWSGLRLVTEPAARAAFAHCSPAVTGHRRPETSCGAALRRQYHGGDFGGY